MAKGIVMTSGVNIFRLNTETINFVKAEQTAKERGINYIDALNELKVFYRNLYGRMPIGATQLSLNPKPIEEFNSGVPYQCSIAILALNPHYENDGHSDDSEFVYVGYSPLSDKIYLGFLPYHQFNAQANIGKFNVEDFSEQHTKKIGVWIAMDGSEIEG